MNKPITRSCIRIEREKQMVFLVKRLIRVRGGVSNVDIDGNNTLWIKAIGVTISTFETLPVYPPSALRRHVLGKSGGLRIENR